MGRLACIAAAALAWGLPALAAAQLPEDRGSLSVGEWDAGGVDAAGVTLPTRVLFPEDGTGPFPLVGVIHGASRDGSKHIELARTLASRGFVVVLPDIPCGFTGCDHDANAAQISALLDWAVAQGGSTSSPIAGLVDGSRRGVIGHSWGALASHIAASRDDSIDSVVLFDPNDDGTVGLDATPSITAPEAQLLAQVAGACNGAWREDRVSAMLPDPNLQLTVSGSAHCDPEEPGDALCPLGCGVGDPSTSSVFRRYAVAWTACVLQDDASMAPWLGGASMTDDEDGGSIQDIVANGLGELPCRGGGPPPSDGGVARTDAGAGVDAGPAGTDAGSPRSDGGAAMDAGVSGADGGTAGGDEGGCGCRTPGGGRGGWPAALVVIGLVGWCVKRRRGARLSPG